MTDSPLQAVEKLQEKMERIRISSNASSMSKYMKKHFPYLGVKSPERKMVHRDWVKTLPKNQDRWDIAFLLWELPEREYQYIAIDYLNKIPKKKIEIGDIKMLEEILTNKSWWDSVDAIASNYVGDYFKKFPEQIQSVISNWRNSDNMWLNRTCLIFQLKYRDETNFELLKDLIIQYQDVKEFFIQKAIGWSLRQHSKYKPLEVQKFINEISLEGLAKREASKYL